jgi:hypothetical protein
LFSLPRARVVKALEAEFVKTDKDKDKDKDGQ